MSNTPSDAELDELIFDVYPTYQAPEAHDRIQIREAMKKAVAKWGTPQPVVREPQCWCLTCKPMQIDDPSSIRMALCPTCGNKRCPKANDYRNQCSNSNVPGQKGSAYEGCGITQKGADDGA